MDKEAPWNDSKVLISAKTYSDKGKPHQFWVRHGGHCPELKRMAVMVLNVVCTASACERNWSAHDIIDTKRRSCMRTTTLNKWVYLFCNIRLLDHMTNGGAMHLVDPGAPCHQQGDNDVSEESCRFEAPVWKDMSF